MLSGTVVISLVIAMMSYYRMKVNTKQKHQCKCLVKETKHVNIGFA